MGDEGSYELQYGAWSGKGWGAATNGEFGGQSKGFFRSLVDLSFTSFITARVVKFIYVLSIIFMVLYVLSTVGWLSFLSYAFVAGISESEALGVVVGVLLFLLLLPIFLLIAIFSPFLSPRVVLLSAGGSKRPVRPA